MTTLNTQLFEAVGRDTLRTWQKGEKKVFSQDDKLKLNQLRRELTVGFLNRVGIVLLRVSSAFRGALDTNYYHDLAMRIGGCAFDLGAIAEDTKPAAKNTSPKKAYKYSYSTIKDDQLAQAYAEVAKMAKILKKDVFSKAGIHAVNAEGVIVNPLAIPVEMVQAALKELYPNK